MSIGDKYLIAFLVVIILFAIYAVTVTPHPETGADDFTRQAVIVFLLKKYIGF